MSASAVEPDEDKPQTYFFTFGADHFWGTEPPRDRYVRLYGTFLQTRAAMFETFGTHWCDQYPSAADAGIRTYRLNEITIPGLAVSEKASAAFALLMESAS